jgi:hypothetical protein
VCARLGAETRASKGRHLRVRLDVENLEAVRAHIAQDVAEVTNEVVLANEAQVVSEAAADASRTAEGIKDEATNSHWPRRTGKMASTKK